MTSTIPARPGVRATDPATSREAAASQRELNIRAVHRELIAVMSELGDATDEQIAEAYEQRPDAPRHTAAGLRHRRLELVEQGSVIETGERRMQRSGRRGRVWRYIGASTNTST